MAIRPNPILSLGSQATIDRLLAGQMADVCTVQRQATQRGVSGAQVTAWGTTAVVPCKVATPGRAPVENVAGARYGPQADYEITVPRDTDIRSTDRILVNGRALDVIFAPLATSFAFVLRVAARATS